MEKLIIRATQLMGELTTTYQKLSSICEQIATAFVEGKVEIIETLTRVGQGELLIVRSKLSQITWVLSAFTSGRSNNPETNYLSVNERSAFEVASKELILAAKNFQQACDKSSILAINGIAFSTVCFEIYGIQPTTYHAPYSIRRNKT